MGANPVQIEIGEFDEAIDVEEEVVEDVAAESKFTLVAHLPRYKFSLLITSQLKSEP